MASARIAMLSRERRSSVKAQTAAAAEAAAAAAGEQVLQGVARETEATEPCLYCRSPRLFAAHCPGLVQCRGHGHESLELLQCVLELLRSATGSHCAPQAEIDENYDPDHRASPA